MGLFDFISDKGEQKPVEPAAKPATGASDFFGNAAKTETSGDTYTVVSGDSGGKKKYDRAENRHPDRRVRIGDN